MKSSNSTAIGLFIVGGVVAFVVAIFLFSSGFFLGRGHSFVLYFTESVNGLDVGAPVKLNGVNVGQVRNILVQFDAEKNQVRVPVLITLNDAYLSAGRHSKVLRTPETLDSYVKQIQPQSDAGDDDEILSSKKEENSKDFLKKNRSHIAYGLVGVLQTESLVTGKLFIELSYVPTDVKRYFQIDSSGYPEIPTHPSNLQRLEDKLVKMADALSEIDYAGIGNSVREILKNIEGIDFKNLMDSISNMANSFSELASGENVQLAINEFGEACTTLHELMEKISTGSHSTIQEVNRAVEQFGTTMQRVQHLLSENSSLSVYLSDFLRETGRAAYSLRSFLDYLERNPNALLTGKYGK